MTATQYNVVTNSTLARRIDPSTNSNHRMVGLTSLRNEKVFRNFLSAINQKDSYKQTRTLYTAKQMTSGINSSYSN